MRFVRDDPPFRRTLICWMLMGFANLMMPAAGRVFGQPCLSPGGLAVTVSTIALLTGVIRILPGLCSVRCGDICLIT
jgi:hypothetical protein